MGPNKLPGSGISLRTGTVLSAITLALLPAGDERSESQ